MSVELDYKIGQLQYEISILGLDKEELTGVTKRTEELKDLVKNLSIHGVVSTCCDETRKVNQFLKRPSKYCMTCSKELK